MPANPYLTPHMISVVELVIQWLTPLGDVGPQRSTTSPLPFRLVEVVAGSDDKVVDSSIVQVSTFAPTYDLAEFQAGLTHQRMLKLGPPLAPQQRVQISGGKTVFVDSITTSQRPIWVQFTEAAPIARFVARYSVEVRLPRIYP